MAWLPSLRPGRDDREQILESVAHAYVLGVQPRWTALHEASVAKRVGIPTYPFERKLFWRKWDADDVRAPAPRPNGHAPRRRALSAAALGKRMGSLPVDARSGALVDHCRNLLGPVLARPASALSAEQNLLEA